VQFGRQEEPRKTAAAPYRWPPVRSLILPSRVRVQSRTKLVSPNVVANHGEPIPRDAAEQLFQPFSRASVRPGQQGLGLGLYIASEIARAHEGSLEVASSPEETRFTFRMPA
jgi:nitrogen-specific signal transduction histidine kinase